MGARPLGRAFVIAGGVERNGRSVGYGLDTGLPCGWPLSKGEAHG